MHHRHSSRFPREMGRSGRDASGLAENAASPEQRAMLREDARQICNARDLRGRLFDPNIFGEPAWEILLALYTIDGDLRRLNTRELSELASVKLTTALRWLDYLDEHGWISRKANPFDQRMVYAELSDKGRATMDDYLLQMHDAGMFRPVTGSKD